MKKLILILVGFSLLACEKTIEFDLPVEDPQLAVTAKIVAGDSIHAVVSISTPALSGTPKFANDAVVLLFEDGIKVDSLTLSSNSRIFGNAVNPVPVYTAQYPFVNGKTYTLKVSKTSYDQVKGSCIVPPKPVVVTGKYFQETKKITGSINDRPGKGDIYKIEVQLKNDNYARGFTSTDLTMEFYEGYSDFLEIDSEGTYGTRAFIRDELFDGGTRNFQINYYDFDGGGSSNDSLFLKITAVSLDQYEFERTLDLGAFSGENPFSEPLSIYSNMSNGKGNFGAENTTFKGLEFQ